MTHDFQTIVVTREIAARPETVAKLWTDPVLKQAWYMDGNGPDWASTAYEGRLSTGDTETCTFTHATMGSFTTRAHAMIDDAPHRLIYAYRMDHDDRPITASLVTIALEASAKGTALTLNEQINFIDGGDSLETRVPGTETIIDKLVTAAEAHP